MKTENSSRATQKWNKNFGNGNVLNFALAGVFAVVLVFLASGNVFAYNIEGGGVCICDSCGDCTVALNDNGNCSSTVKLNTSITTTGDCITNQANFNNKIFDCQGNTIDGDGSFGYQGINLNEKQNNTIKNCIITDFAEGIHLHSSSNNTLINNTANNNQYGILLDSSSNNILTNNTANNNNHGIYFGGNNNNNTMIANNLCRNFQYDIYVEYVEQTNATTGDNNTCLTYSNYNDVTNVSGCKYICQIDNCNCSSCGECSYKLSHPSCSQVNLTKDIMNHKETCILNPENFNNKIFDCRGHVIDGTKNSGSSGITFKHKQNNTIKNCVIAEFERGIEIGDSVNNTLVNNTLNSLENGILLMDSSSNNILTNNTLNSNEMGIYLDYSTKNTLRNNTIADSRYNFGINGGQISDFYQDIDVSNLVNGKPIFYWTNEKNAPNSCKNAEISELNNTDFVALVSCDNITVKNLNLLNNSHGILLVNTTNSKILNNTANSNMFGIQIFFSFNNTLTNNTANSNMLGIGLFLSPNNTLRNNTFTNNRQNFNIEGLKISHFYQDIDKSNSVDTKPIFYWTNEKNAPNSCKNTEINELNNSGFVALISCDNITVKNLNLHNNSHGILLINTTNSKIINNTANLNGFGVVLVSSNNNIIGNNTVNLNMREGISLREGIGLFLSSNNNILINNTANSNKVTGIHLGYSSDNILINNTANYNDWNGIYLNYSSNNNVTNNTVNSNTNDGISLYLSSNNTLRNNNINENNKGIYSENSNSTLFENKVCDNIQSDFYSSDWSESNGNNNTCSNSNGWNDTGTGTTGGCTYICIVNCNCSSCQGCNAKLNNPVCSIVTLKENIVVPLETFPTCIDNPKNFTNKTFDCQGHTIIGNGNGVGIYLLNKTGNTIKNCIVTDFYDGIYLYSSSNNTLTNNTANHNTNGFSLWYSSNNTLTNNTANNNNQDGIYLYYSSNNTITNNTANNNTHYGIHLYSSSNNILTSNTANDNNWRGIYSAYSSRNASILEVPIPANFHCFLPDNEHNTECSQFYKTECISNESCHIACPKFYNPVYDLNGTFYPTACWAEHFGVTDYQYGFSEELLQFIRDLWSTKTGVGSFIVPSPHVDFDYGHDGIGAMFRSSLWVNTTDYYFMDFCVSCYKEEMYLSASQGHTRNPVMSENLSTLLVYIKHDDAYPEQSLLNWTSVYEELMNDYLRKKQNVSNPIQYNITSVIISPPQGVKKPSAWYSSEEIQKIYDAAIQNISNSTDFKVLILTPVIIGGSGGLYTLWNDMEVIYAPLTPPSIYYAVNNSTTNKKAGLDNLAAFHEMFSTISHEVLHAVGLPGDHVLMGYGTMYLDSVGQNVDPVTGKEREPPISWCDFFGTSPDYYSVELPTGLKVSLGQESDFPSGNNPIIENSSSGRCLYGFYDNAVLKDYDNDGEYEIMYKNNLIGVELQRYLGWVDIDKDGISELDDSNPYGDWKKVEDEQETSVLCECPEYRTTDWFAWDNVPGEDNAKLASLLFDVLNITWVENATVNKSDDNKTIIVANGENSLTLNLNKEKTNVTLETNDGKISLYIAIAKEEYNKLIIYIILPDPVPMDACTSLSSTFEPLEEVTIGGCKFESVRLENGIVGFIPLQCAEFNSDVVNLYKHVKYNWGIVEKEYGTVLLPRRSLKNNMCYSGSFSNNTASLNGVGIYLYDSSNNIITNNTANSNDYGIFVYYSPSNNTLTNNTANNNTYYGIFLDSSSNNTFANNTANNNRQGISLSSSSNNTITNNTANYNNWGIYIFGGSNFNRILNNKILNNNETGITISNCYHRLSQCPGGNSNNTIEGNKILNNKIGIFSQQSNSTINNNTVCGNTNLDFDFSNSQSGSGDNNTCNSSKVNRWKDNGRTGTENGCKNECAKCKEPKDIFDAVEMLEYLSGDKESNPQYCDLNNDTTVNLLDVLALIDKIVIQN